MDRKGNIRLAKLLEREKELNCLYTVENLLIQDHRKLEYIMKDLVEAIPAGWQYPTVCECRISHGEHVYKSDDFIETEYLQSANIYVDDQVEGKIEIIYTQLIRMHRGSAFLPEEQKLLNTIAGNIGKTIFRRKLKSTLDYIHKRSIKQEASVSSDMILRTDPEQHWKWRLDMVHKISEHLDMEKYGIKGIYLIGSTKNANAGPGSDIDLIVHTYGDRDKELMFIQWIEGWGRCLDEINYAKTGYRELSSLIDLHIITDEDIKNKTSYARMINAVTDRARPIKVV